MVTKPGRRMLREDIRLFLAFAEDAASLAAGKEASGKIFLTAPQLLERVPASVIRLTRATGDNDEYAELKESLNADEAADLERIREVGNEHLAALRDHPAAPGALRQARTRGPDPRKAVKRIGYVTGFAGSPPTLVPQVELSLFDRTDELLLTSTLALDDFGFLLGSLTDILEEVLNDTKQLAKMVNRGEHETLRTWLGQTRESLTRAEEAYEQLLGEADDARED